MGSDNMAAVDRFGREIDDDQFNLTFENGGHVRMLGERRGASGGVSGSESFHSPYFREAMAELRAGQSAVKPVRTRGLSAGLVIAAVVFCYGLLAMDIPVIYLAFSFIIYAFAPTLGKLSPAHSAAIQQAVRTFSVTTFVGAIVMAMV